MASRFTEIEVFTGLIEGTAECTRVEVAPEGAVLTLDLGALAEGVRTGDSIAVDGCCLTAARIEGGSVQFQLVPETLGRTTLGALRSGRRCNVERSLRLGDRLGGHLVSGHIDGVGRIREIEERGTEWRVSVAVEPELRRFCIEKGSVAVSGTSLTIAAVDPVGFTVALIPHTRAATTLGRLAPGDAVNVEVDVLGKWVARLLEGGRSQQSLDWSELARGTAP